MGRWKGCHFKITWILIDFYGKKWRCSGDGNVGGDGVIGGSWWRRWWGYVEELRVNNGNAYII